MATLLLVSAAAARERARLAARCGPDHATLLVEGWSRVPGVMERESVRGVVVDSLGGRLPFGELSWLRRVHPGVASVVILDPNGREHDLFRLGRIGVDGVRLTDGPENEPTLARVIERALARAVGRRVAGRLGGRVPASFLEALCWAVEHAHRDPGSADLARAMASPSVRSYRRELRRAGLPSPSRILLWGRLLRAADLLGADRRAVDRVAHRLGYAAASSLARALRRETGLPPSEIRLRGGVTCVLEALLNGPDLPRARSRARRARRSLRASDEG